MEKKWRVLVLVLAVVTLVVSGCANKWKTSGKIAMGQKNWEKAMGDFEKALEQDPKDGEAHFLLARCYAERGDYESMIPHLDAADSLYEKGESKIRELRIDTWQELFNAGIKDANEEDYEKANGDFGLAIAMLPERYEAYTNKAFVLERVEKHDSALFYYSEAYRMDPGNLKILENYASISFNMKNWEKADSLYAEILVQDPKHAEALMRRGDIAREKNDNAAAVDFYNQAVEAEPSNCDLWFNMGVLYFQQLKNNEEAMRAFSRAKEICPDDINVLVNLGVVLLSMGNLDEALAHLESFTRDFPDECTAWDLYSQALLRKGLRQKAVEANDRYEECKGSKK